MEYLLRFIAALLNGYYILCFINILLSWIPGLKFTKFGKFVSSITDPYLRFFSRNGKFVVGNVDFSPIISIGLLVLVSSIIGRVASTGRINLSWILATTFYTIWSISSSLLTIFFVLFLVRWIVLLCNHGNTPYDSGWNRIDVALMPVSYKMAKLFTKKYISYQNALLLSWIILLTAYIILFILIGFYNNRGVGIIIQLLARIPA